jgi:hypothetical protein
MDVVVRDVSGIHRLRLERLVERGHEVLRARSTTTTTTTTTSSGGWAGLPRATIPPWTRPAKAA